jgi:hypothetical protein
MSRFSPSALHCFGAATIEASMISPLIAREPGRRQRRIETVE